MKEEQRIGFYKDGQQEKVLGINYIGEMNREDVVEKILEIISSESEHKRIVITGGTGGDNHWNCIFLTEAIPIDKIKPALKHSGLNHTIRVYLTYKRPGYWVIEDNDDIISYIKDSPKVIDFK